MGAGTSPGAAVDGRSAGRGPEATAAWPEAAAAWPEATRAALARAGGRGGDGDGDGGWNVTVGGFWCTARPSASAPLPAQGWKLHVSAATVVGGEVLAAVVRVLAADPCSFKFAAAEERLRELNSLSSDRGSAGNFITVYPADDAQFQRLAAGLDRATAGLPGPVVLSGRPYRPGSRVHYRYGAFATRAELGNDGEYRSVLRGPGGERAEDVRGGSYRAPGRVRDPFAAPGAPGAPAGPRRGGRGVLLAGREAASGAEVVVKQARAHIEVDRAGTDARDALRHEAALLTRLDGQGLVPRAVELIEQDDSVFLVQERIAGQPLDAWVAARLRRDGGPDVDWAEAEPVVHGLLDLVERVHGQGLVLRDLSPGNVMVRPDGSLGLIGLELAAETGHRVGTPGTPGYRAPEQDRLALAGSSTADPAVDRYALGGLLFLLSTGHDPLLPEDLPQARPVAERLGRWLALAARSGATARRLAPVVLGLRAEQPELRWSLARAREALGRRGSGAERSADRPADGAAVVVTPLWQAAATPHGAGVYGPLPDRPLPDRLLHDGLRQLAVGATPERSDRLWPVVPAGERTDPCNVQHGAAGVLAVLARAVSAEALPAEVRAEAARTARSAMDWIERRVAAEPVVLPGLHFGRSGTAWALLDAARVLGDPEAAERAAGDAEALRLARAAGRAVLAGRWHSGVSACHGLAGDGEYLLDLAAAADDPEFRSGADELARLIAARAALRDGLPVLPDETGTGCAAAYGTGTAGPLTFLLRLRHGGPRLRLDPVSPVSHQLPCCTGGVSEA